MKIRFKHRGNFNKLESFLIRMTNLDYLKILEKYGQQGVEALSEATPKGGTGKTAASWTYEIERTKTQTIIGWLNTNTNDGVNIAILLQYGHGTNWGGYVKGRDFINPALAPIFDKMANEVWKEVTRK